MGKKRKSLGRGLASILGNNHIEKSKETEKNISTNLISEVILSNINTNPFQPRINFKQEKLNELAESIEQLGVIQPITLRKMDSEKYQLISGERRFRAAKLAGLNKIPAFIRIANDQEMLEMALVENIQREDLNPIEIALSYKRLIDEIKLTQEECSERVGKNRSTITNFLRLLKLPSEIQKGIKDGSISNGHAKALLSIQDEKSQLNLYRDIINQGYSVREVEQIAKDFKHSNYKQISKKNNIQITPTIPFSQQKIIYHLSQKLNLKAEIKSNKNGNGKLIITFKNEEHLMKIFNIIKE